MTVYRPPGTELYKYDFVISGRRYTGTTKRTLKREALLVEAEKRKAVLDAEQLGVRGAVTLGEAVARYLASIKQQSDYLGQVSRSEKLLGRGKNGKRFGLSPDLALDRIDDGVVAELVEARVSENMKPRTINLELKLLQRMCNVARKRWRVRSATVDWSEHVFKVKGVAKPLAQAEVDALVAAMQPSARLERVKNTGRKITDRDRRCIQDDYDFLIYLLDTGMRHTEAAEITWDKHHMNQRTISVFRSKVENESLVGVSDRLFAILQRRYAERTGPYVFPNVDGDGPRPYHRSNAMRRIMVRLGINSADKVARYGRRSIHAMRDTFATRVGPKLGILGLKHILGHTSVKTTEKYVGLIDDQFAKAVADALNTEK